MAQKTSQTIFRIPDLLDAIKRHGAENVFRLAPTARAGGKVTYQDVFAKTDTQDGRLRFHVQHEKNGAGVKPVDPRDVTAFNTQLREGQRPIEARNQDPTFTVNKYKCRLATADDGKTRLMDASGHPIMPTDDQKSQLFELIDCLDAWFYNAISKLKADGIVVEVGDRNAKPVDGQFKVASVKICPVGIQRDISLKSPNVAERGKPIENPMVRIKCKANPKTGLFDRTEFFDGSKRFTDPKTGKTNCEPYLVPEEVVDGDTTTIVYKPVVNRNIHKAIVYGTLGSGVISADAVCYSNMGVSIPLEFEIAVLTAPVGEKKASISDVFDLEDEMAAALPAVGAGGGAPRADYLDEEDLDDALEGM